MCARWRSRDEQLLVEGMPTLRGGRLDCGQVALGSRCTPMCFVKRSVAFPGMGWDHARLGLCGQVEWWDG